MKIPKGLFLDLFKHSSFSMNEIDDATVPLVITSPLYFPDSVSQSIGRSSKDGEHKEHLVDEISFYARSLYPVFSEIVRILSPGGHLILQTRDVRVDDRLVPVECLHREACEKVGLFLIARHFWRSTFQRAGRRKLSEKLKNTVGPMPSDPEVFLVFQKPGTPYLGQPSDQDIELLSVDFMKTTTGKLKSRHPYQAPLPILNAFVRTYSLPGDTIVDPFAGCGTTAMAALKNERNAVLYEIEDTAIGMIEDNFQRI